MDPKRVRDGVQPYARVYGARVGCRFFSRIMASFQQFVTVFEYIDQNPVEANQVEDVTDWEYGGLWHDRHGIRGILDGLGEWGRLIYPEHELLQLGNEQHKQYDL